AITLLEGRDRLGGVITTLHRDGFVVEGGPDSFIIQKPWALQLCHDLRIEGRLLAPDPRNRRVYVLSRDRLISLPPGLMMGAPTRLGSFLSTRLVSWPGKIRMAFDLFLPRGAEDEDESLGGFIRRRVGQEALDKIADPILGGIHAAGADRLSLLFTFPRLKESLAADAVILAMPPPAACALLRPGFPELAEAISAIPSVSTATVSLAYRDAKPSVALDGTGFVIARGESRRILACTWSSQKFSGRAPAG